MKKLLVKLLKLEPETIVKYVPKEIEVIKEMPQTKVIEMLDGFQEKLSNRSTVNQLCMEHVTDYERGRIQGQIDMLTKIMIEMANEES